MQGVPRSTKKCTRRLPTMSRRDGRICAGIDEDSDGDDGREKKISNGRNGDDGARGWNRRCAGQSDSRLSHDDEGAERCVHSAEPCAQQGKCGLTPKKLATFQLSMDLPACHLSAPRPDDTRSENKKTRKNETDERDDETQRRPAETQRRRDEDVACSPPTLLSRLSACPPPSSLFIPTTVHSSRLSNRPLNRRQHRIRFSLLPHLPTAPLNACHRRCLICWSPSPAETLQFRAVIHDWTST